MSTPKILVVDDNLTSADLLRTILQEGDRFTVELAGDGAGAIAAIEASPPDLVLLDVVMPGLDGYDVLANLRGRPETQRIPVIILSCQDGMDDRVRGLERGGDDYLVKPVQRAELIARIHVHLRVKGLREEVEAARSVIMRRERLLAELTVQRRRLTRLILSDLQTPLMAVDANLCALRRELSASAPPVMARLDGLESGLAMVARLAGELREVGELDRLHVEPQRVRFAPWGVINAAMNEIAAHAERAGKRVMWACGGELPAVETDPSLLREVLTAAVGHAVAMTCSRGAVRVQARGVGDAVEISIVDDAVATPSGLLASLSGAAAAEPRVDAESPARGGGISCARVLVEALGGRFWVEPRHDSRGTVSRVVIPVRVVAEPDTCAPGVDSLSALVPR